MAAVWLSVVVIVCLQCLLSSIPSDSKVIVKRQTSLAFTSSIYNFCLGTSSAYQYGLLIGQLATNVPANFTIYAGTSNAAINYLTGQLYLANNITASNGCFIIPVRATGSSTGTSTGTSITTNVVVNPTCNSVCTGAVTTSSIVTTASSVSGTAPTFASLSYTLTFPSCSSATLIGTVAAAATTTTTYYSLSGANAASIAISPSTGQLYLSQRPTVDPLQFNVIAVNSAGNKTVPVTVYTTCLQPPAFTPTTYTFAAANCGIGSFIGQVTANTSAPPLSYSITTAASAFSVSSTGVIVANTNLMSPSTYTITVQASDSLGRTSTAAVTITTSATCTNSAVTVTGSTVVPTLPPGFPTGPAPDIGKK